jgi:hypothetical protein
MLNLSRILIFVSFLMFGSLACANADCAPLNFTMEKNDMVLQGNPKTSTQVFFFHNKSNKSIFLDRGGENPGASAGWSTYLRPDHWSVLLLNKKSFTVHCTMIEPGTVVVLNCKDMIEVCTPPNLTLNKKLKGNFWLAEDKPFESVVKILEKKGITTSPTSPDVRGTAGEVGEVTPPPPL